MSVTRDPPRPDVRAMLRAAARPAGTVAAGLLTFILAALPFSRGGGTAAVRVDMEVTAGRSIQVFLNDLARPPIGVTPELGVRRTYSFPFEREDLVLLRLDPTDAAGATVRIHGIEVVDGGRTVARFDPGAIRAWSGIGFTIADDPSALVVRTLTDDPMLVTWQPIDVEEDDAWYAWLRGVVLHRADILPFLLLPALILAAAHRGNIAPAVMLGCVLAVIPLVARAGQAIGTGPDTIDVAVSRATFSGRSVRTNQAISMMALAVAIGLGFGAAFLIRRRAVDPAALPAGDARAAPPARGWILPAWWAALGIVLAPDLAGVAAGIGTLNYVPHWDHDLLTYWAYHGSRGDLPYRDFWYPYGGQFLFDLAWPAGPAIRWIFDVLLFGTLSTSLWRLAPRRRAAALAVVGALLVAERIGLVFTLNRYLLAPNMALAYLAAARVPRIAPGVALLAAATTALTLVFEPLQITSAIVAIGVVWLFDAMPGGVRSVTAFVRSIRIPLLFTASAIGGAAAVAALLAWTGQLRGVVDFYSTLGQPVQYAAFPTPTGTLGWRLLELNLAVIWWPIAAIAIGLHERIAARTPDASLRGSAVLAIGLIAFLVLQKHLIRAMGGQLIVYPLLGGLLYALFAPRPARRAATLTLAAAAGLLLAVASVQSRPDSLVALLTSGPSRVVGSLAAMGDPSTSARVNDERFAPARFARYPAERELVAALDARAPGPLTLFALTDAPALYILTGQRALWVCNMYDASPVDDQERMVSWLRATPPEFVVFQAGQLEFDSVPTAVRVPLIVAEVVERYVPDSRIGRFEVLRPRMPGEAVPLDYWRMQLGATLELGHVPAVVDVSTRRRCQDDACEEYAVADASSPPGPGKQTLPVAVAGTTFAVRFDLEPGRTRYVVPLSRLWFWRAARASGARVEILPAGNGFNVQRRMLVPDASRLY